ncbi:unnamed protein product [Linum trigynum]|uniref:Methyltransferase n=1 Tax=Linum trigynum TaxID=586398 RepID=A0AAV2DEU5_9ROSI
MAAVSISPYHPTSKPPKPTFPALFSQRLNPYTFGAVLLLCFSSYFLGVWHHGHGGGGATSATNLVSIIPCAPATTTAAQINTPGGKALDFTTHHAAKGGGGGTAAGGPTAKRNFPPCASNFSEYTPCEDRIRSLRFKRDRLIYRERHCPAKEEIVKCRVPAPFGYRNPFTWPASRDYAWFANVPHKHLTVEKAVQNWISYEGDRFRFPGGGTMFPDGADKYIDDVGKLINLKDGSIRTAVDTGCGVASWGAYLLSRNILTMSFAPRDTHEAQVQFALERGVPAMIGVLASKRLPYPSRAFDMAHCSRCLIPWAESEGQYLMEVDRILRPGGYWILSGPPIRWKKYWKGWERSQEDLKSEQDKIEAVAKSLCWKKYVEKGDIAIWQKPLNHFGCSKSSRGNFCPAAQDADKAWYTKLETCVTNLPEVSAEEEQVAGGKLAKWPQRLTSVPPRISRGTVKGVTAESFQKDTQLWKKRVAYYKTVNNQLDHAGRYRNLLDMNAGLGGFAAAMVKDPVWVMNVVPVHSINTLGAVYERGLIGTYQNWCEAMSTYPRTYDLLHADRLFTLYDGRCEMEDILLEMDRVLRPEGGVILRDDVDMLVKIKKITDGLKWESKIVDHEDGPYEREKLLFAVKSYWTAPAGSQLT